MKSKTTIQKIIDGATVQEAIDYFKQKTILYSQKGIAVECGQIDKDNYEDIWEKQSNVRKDADVKEQIDWLVEQGRMIYIIYSQA